MDPIKPLLFHPEILDESAWFLGTLPWMDEQKRWSLGFIGTPGGGDVGYNTDLVKPSLEVPPRDYSTGLQGVRNIQPRAYPDPEL